MLTKWLCACERRGRGVRCWQPHAGEAGQSSSSLSCAYAQQLACGSSSVCKGNGMREGLDRLLGAFSIMR